MKRNNIVNKKRCWQSLGMIAASLLLQSIFITCQAQGNKGESSDTSKVDTKAKTDVPPAMITLTPEEKSIINAVNAFKKALSSNNINNVLPLIAQGRRPYYQNRWKDGKNLNLLAQRMQNIMKPEVGNGWAEVYVFPPEEADNQGEVYILDFEQDSTGTWYLISY